MEINGTPTMPLPMRVSDELKIGTLVRVTMDCRTFLELNDHQLKLVGSFSRTESPAFNRQASQPVKCQIDHLGHVQNDAKKISQSFLQ
jgi:hypothetical protein